MEAWTEQSTEWNKLIHARSHTRSPSGQSVHLRDAISMLTRVNLLFVSEAHES